AGTDGEAALDLHGRRDAGDLLLYRDGLELPAGQLALEARVEELDALLQRRMGRHQRSEMRDPFAEVEVAGLLRPRSDQPGAAVETADLLQRSHEPGRVSGELNARRVGEQLALPANRGLDEPGEEHADRADQVERDPDEDDGAQSTGVDLAPASRVARPSQRPQELGADQTDHEDA